MQQVLKILDRGAKMSVKPDSFEFDSTGKKMSGKEA